MCVQHLVCMQFINKCQVLCKACCIYSVQTALLQVNICGRRDVKAKVVPALKNTCWRRQMVVVIGL